MPTDLAKRLIYLVIFTIIIIIINEISKVYRPTGSRYGEKHGHRTPFHLLLLGNSIKAAG